MYYGEYNIYNKSLKQEQYNNDYGFGCQKRRCIIISNAERIKMECISMMRFAIVLVNITVVKP